MSFYIGIDVGGTNIKGGIVSRDGGIVLEKSVSTAANGETDGIFITVAGLVENLIAQASLRREDISHIGIGCAGDIDSTNGVIVRSCNLGVCDAPIKAQIEKKTGIEVFVGNDADCAAVGEFIVRRNQKINHLVCITIGTGIGAGIIIHKKLYTGGNGCAGEIGHMQIVENGDLCSCGQRGCFEAQASVKALKRYTKEELLKNSSSIMWDKVGGDTDSISGKTAFEAARQGDLPAISVVKRYTGYLGIGIANVVNILSPDILVIGGAISREGDYLLDPVLTIVEQKRFKKTGRQTQIVASLVGNKAGIIGSACLPFLKG